jgi:hypothetical protein
MSEHEPRRRRHSTEPRHPIALPADLARFLIDQPGYTCVFAGSDQGTMHIITVPSRDLPTVRGRFPIEVRHELHRHPASPVVRTIISLYDQPEQALRVETFTNIGAPDQREQFASLAEQEDYLVLFYDEWLRHRLSKRVPNTNRDGVTAVLTHADALLAAIPAAQRDFDRAKQAVMERTHL